MFANAPGKGAGPVQQPQEAAPAPAPAAAAAAADDIDDIMGAIISFDLIGYNSIIGNK